MHKYKKYNRYFQYDNGALEAYHRGEKPQSYWTKKSILDDLYMVVDHSDKELGQIYVKYATNKTMVKQQLSKISKKILLKYCLIHTGTHQTGNYYQNTSFYRVLNSEELREFLLRFVLRPTTGIQLSLL